MNILANLTTLDARAFLALNAAGIPSLDSFMFFISDRKTWWWVSILVSLIVLIKRDRRLWGAWILILLTLGVSDGLTYYVLKEYFQRIRPCFVYGNIRLLNPGCGGRFGFPSNHAATGMAISVLSAFMFRSRKTIPVFLGAILVGYSRVYLGVHYPGDVLAGFVEGALLSCLIYFLFNRYFSDYLPSPKKTL